MSEIFIYDEIGPDYYGLVSAKQVMRDLEAVGRGKPVTVRINSPGGSVVEAQAIYNAIRRHSEAGGKVTMAVDALAASAASYIAMAGDEIEMAENSMMMIHHAWSIAIGNAAEMRKAAEVLSKFDDGLTAVYASRSKKTVQEITDMLAAETWLNAQEAVDAGLADSVGQPLNIAASIQEGRFAKTPERFLTGKLPPEREKKNESRTARVAAQIRIAKARLGVA